MSDTNAYAADVVAANPSPASQFQSPTPTQTSPMSSGETNSSGQGELSTGASNSSEGTPGVSDAQAVQDLYDYVVDGNASKVPKAVIDQAAEALGLDPKELLRGGQLNKAGYEKLRQANEYTKKIEKFAAMLEQDGPGALESLARAQGVDPEAFQQSIENWLVKKYTASTLSPEQKRIQELEAREAQLKAYEEKMKADAEEARIQKQVEADRPRLENEVREAFAKIDFPHTPSFMRRTAETMLEYLDEGINLTFADAAAMVKQEVKSYVGGVRKELKSIDDIRKVFGDDLIDQIRKMDVEQLRGSSPAKRTSPEQPRPAVKPSGRGIKSMDEAEQEAQKAMDAFFGQRR